MSPGLEGVQSGGNKSLSAVHAAKTSALSSLLIIYNFLNLELICTAVIYVVVIAC